MLSVAQILRDASQQSIYGDPRPRIDMECAGFCGQGVYSYAEYAEANAAQDPNRSWTVSLDDDGGKSPEQPDK